MDISEFIGETRRQHYLSVGEQRFNCFNPDAKRGKLKLYRFNVINKSGFILDEPEKVKAENSYLDIDLFTFKLLDRSYRKNYENLFKQFEDHIVFLTEKILKEVKLKNNFLGQEIFHLFIIKLTNLIKNPKSIKHTLDIFNGLLRYRFKNKEIDRVLSEVQNPKNPSLNHICKKYSISEIEYKDWLNIIFSLFVNIDGKQIYQQILKDIFEDPSISISVRIYCFDEESCLLSDLGYTKPNINDDALCFDFNISSTCFIRYIFYSGNNRNLNPHLKECGLKIIFNCYESLSSYNKIVINQCDKYVYNSISSVYFSDI